MTNEFTQFKQKHEQKYRIFNEYGTNGEKLSTFIPSRIHPPEKIEGHAIYTYMVYPSSTDGKTLAAVMPKQLSKKLLSEFPDILSYEIEDDISMVLLFDEEGLPKVARRMKLAGKKRLSSEHKEKLIKGGAGHRFKAQHDGTENGKTA